MVTVSKFVLFQISNSEKPVAGTEREDLPPSESNSNVKTVDKSQTSKDDGKDPVRSFSGKVADPAEAADNTEGPEGLKTVEKNEVEGDGNVKKEDSNTASKDESSERKEDSKTVRKDELERVGSPERNKDSKNVRKGELEGDGSNERSENSNNVRKDDLGGGGSPERNEDSNNVRNDELGEDKSTGKLEDSPTNNPESHDSAE
jgi:hypothetical protein